MTVTLVAFGTVLGAVTLVTAGALVTSLLLSKSSSDEVNLDC